MQDQDAMTPDEDLARADELAQPQAQGEEQDGCEDGTCEIEHEGQVYRLPAALKGAFLRQADYTRKTQELAAHRRAAIAERQALAEHADALHGDAGDRGHLAALDQQLAAFAGVDWQALSQGDPQQAQDLWGRFQHTKALREQYAYAIAHRDQHGKLEAARHAAEQMAQTGKVLQREIEGWSPEVAAKLVDYAQAFGVTLDELSQIADPRLWRVLHRAYQGDQAGQREAAARAQAVRPAVQVSGAAAGSGGVRDELGTKEWMSRRNEQLRKGR